VSEVRLEKCVWRNLAVGEGELRAGTDQVRGRLCRGREGKH